MHRSSNILSRLKARLKKVPGLVGLVRLCKFIAVPACRKERRLRMRTRPDNLFQPSTLTAFDRYPRIFSYVRERVQDEQASCILSFGCSTGEEVLSLRHYFSRAKIVGIDINPHCIAVCNKKLARLSDDHLHFKLAGSTQAEPAGSYDAVFCMAVFRHGELGMSASETCDHLIRFGDFENMVRDLYRVLKPGGYLVVRHSNFRFADTSSSAEFDAVFSTKPLKDPAKTPLYGKDNRLLVHAVYNDVVFRKREMV